MVPLKLSEFFSDYLCRVDRARASEISWTLLYGSLSHCPSVPPFWGLPGTQSAYLTVIEQVCVIYTEAHQTHPREITRIVSLALSCLPLHSIF